MKSKLQAALVLTHTLLWLFFTGSQHVFYFNLYLISFTFEAPRGQVLCKRNADPNELACTLNCSSGESPAIPKPRFQSKGGHTFVNSTMS